MKLAYIILAYKDVEQVSRLIDRLRTNNSVFVIHVCKNARKNYKHDLIELQGDVHDMFFCKRENGMHFYWGLVQGTINALQFLIDKKIEFDYVNLISGQDYPIKTNEEITDFFNKNKGKQFIKYWPFFPSEGSEFFENHPWGEHRQLYRIDRYNIKFSGRINPIPEIETGRYVDFPFWRTLKIFIFESKMHLKNQKWISEFLIFCLSRILPRRRKIPTSIDFYGGKTWWSITKDCAEYIVNVNAKKNQYKDFFKYSLIPDESYFQTVIMNSKFKDSVVNDYVREIIWEGGDGTHPITFQAKDIELLKNSDMLFARKFDLQVDTVILDLIDKEILK
jgi:hypothetical protein